MRSLFIPCMIRRLSKSSWPGSYSLVRPSRGEERFEEPVLAGTAYVSGRALSSILSTRIRARLKAMRTLIVAVVVLAVAVAVVAIEAIGAIGIAVVGTAFGIPAVVVGILAGFIVLSIAFAVGTILFLVRARSRRRYSSDPSTPLAKRRVEPQRL